MMKKFQALLIMIALVLIPISSFAEGMDERVPEFIDVTGMENDAAIVSVYADTAENGCVGLPITWKVEGAREGSTYVFYILCDGIQVYTGEATAENEFSYTPITGGVHYAYVTVADSEGSYELTSAEIEVASKLLIGIYEQDRKEDTIDPVEWQIVSVEGEKALVISKYILKTDSYFDPYWIKYKYCNWEGSIIGSAKSTNYLGNTNGKKVNVSPDSIPLKDGTRGTEADLFPEHCRYWCNETFYKGAFTDEEKGRILLSALTNPDSPQGIDCGPDTQDYVFFLSYEELLKYFPVEKDRSSSMTAQAKSELPKGKPVRYWLRTNGEFRCNAMFVAANQGSVSVYGSDVGHNTIGFRPAMWITIGG